MPDHQYQTVLYTHVTPEIVRVAMNRPEARNAQDLQMTYDLNDAFDRAAQDSTVKVIILSGEGPHFSSGHDMRGGLGKTFDDFKPVGFDAPRLDFSVAVEGPLLVGISRSARRLWRLGALSQLHNHFLPTHKLEEKRRRKGRGPLKMDRTVERARWIGDMRRNTLDVGRAR